MFVRSTLKTAGLVLAMLLAGRSASAEAIRVTYVSIEAVYVNAGKSAGLLSGDTLQVQQGARRGVRLIVTNISSQSSACRLMDPQRKVEVGDMLVPLHRRSPATASKPAQGGGQRDKTPVSVVQRRPRREEANRVRGYVTWHNHYQKDLGDADISWYRPTFSGRVTIDNLWGKDFSFRMRHLSRWTHRSRTTSDIVPQDEWVHRMSELSISYGDRSSGIQAGVGRVISPYIRGIGYLDGAYVAARAGSNYLFGAAFGSDPDPVNSGFNPSSKKGGVFATRESIGDRHRLATTVALSASYMDGVVSREFVYLQNTFSFASRLRIYQSVEIDMNRQWRREVVGERLTFSNFYLTSSVDLNPYVTVDGSFDTRRNVRDIHTIATPDSLFDPSYQRGVDGGVSLRLPHHIRLRGTAGKRYGTTSSQDVQFASVYGTVPNFIRRGHHLTMRVSRSKTNFTTAYGPMVMYRGQTRILPVHASLGAYLYDTEGLQDRNYYVELGTNRTFGSRYFLGGTWRQYFSGSLQSVEFGLELSTSF